MIYEYIECLVITRLSRNLQNIKELFYSIYLPTRNSLIINTLYVIIYELINKKFIFYLYVIIYVIILALIPDYHKCNEKTAPAK